MKQQINLYQGGLRRETATFSAVAMGASIAVCVIGLAAGWFGASRHAETIDIELKAVSQQETAAAARLQELTNILASGMDEEQKSANLKDALDALARRERMLDLIAGPGAGAVAGFSTPLRGLAGHEVKGLWLTRVQIQSPDMRTTLEGRATSPSLVPEYLLGLSAKGVLSGQRFDQFEIERSEEEDDPAVHFSMTSQVAERAAQQASQP